VTSTSAAVSLPAVAALVRAVRLHQWSKNLLVFVPLLAAHRLHEGEALARVGLAFLSFGLVASALYVVNDLVDLESDRAHPRKRLRPFASGALPARAGVVLAPVLLAAGAGVGSTLPPAFRATLAGYFVATLLYSLALKRVEVLDVLVLAGLYTLRIYAGSFAAGAPVSQWLASFSLFFFLSLALAKRATELGRTAGRLPGRAYVADDLVVMSVMGVVSGYLSVLVLALYVNSPDVTRLYARPAWLWGLCVLVLYWVSRVWLRAWRGSLHEDPVVFAIRDPVSWAVALAAAAVIRLGT
jgi:4-hydroxybenzoate polyprenyltransferase